MPPAGNGDDTFSVSVGVKAPIDRSALRGGTRSAEANRRAAEADRQAVRQRVDRETHVACVELTMIDRQLDLLERTALAQAQQALDLTLAAYASGEADVAELLVSERAFLDIRRRIARLSADWHQAQASLDHATGATAAALSLGASASDRHVIRMAGRQP